VGENRSSYSFFALFLVLSIVTTLLYQQGRLLLLEDLLQHVLRPAQEITARSAAAVAQAIATGRKTAQLAEENQQLRRQVNELLAEVVRLRGAEIENRILREQVQYASEHRDLTFVSARVIGTDPGNLIQSLVIDRGSSSGIREGMTVVAPAGLVGRIIHVTPSTAKVLLIINPSSSVNAMIQSPESRATGLVNGTVSGRLVMKYILQGERLKVGDLVVTSGLGGQFPPNQLIGRVVSFTQRDVDMFLEAEVQPLVDFRRLEQVMVITSFVPLQDAR
jgi:rod shape-determining protein MreC